MGYYQMHSDVNNELKRSFEAEGIDLPKNKRLKNG